jgi:hypothetical protein
MAANTERAATPANLRKMLLFIFFLSLIRALFPISYAPLSPRKKPASPLLTNLYSAQPLTSRPLPLVGLS